MPTPSSILPLVFSFALIIFVSCSNSALTDEEEGTALVTFKNGADLHNKLDYSSFQAKHHCHWEGVRCVNGSIVTYTIENLRLQGTFPSRSLSMLLDLTIINLNGNLLSGPIPDLSALKNLKSLFLSENHFSGSFPPSVLVLERLVAITLSENHLSGSLPIEILGLKKLIVLKLNSNYFNGSLPPLDQQHLRVLNVSDNNLSGPLPWTKTLSKFNLYSFAKNPNLCGELIQKECPHPHPTHPHPRHLSKLKLALIIIFVIFTITVVVIVVMIKKKNKSGKGFIKMISMQMVRRHR